MPIILITKIIVQDNPPLFIYIYLYEKEKFKKEFANLLAKGRLELLINEKFVELKSSRLETSNCIDKEGRMNCYVYLNSIDISVYFPDFDKLKLKK